MKDDNEQFPENTTTDLKCECCGEKAIGVCSTIMPYSAAFCEQCLSNNTQPAFIIDAAIVSCDCEINNMDPFFKHLTIFHNGHYVTFNDYYKKEIDRLKVMAAEIEKETNEQAQSVFEINHCDLVAALVKPAKVIAEEMTEDEADMIHAIMGICGEAGELLDAIKKSVIYKKQLDRENVVEELGDMEFYMEQLRQRIGITRDETIKHNIAKLTKRYSDMAFSNEAAIIRADKSDGDDNSEQVFGSEDDAEGDYPI